MASERRPILLVIHDDNVVLRQIVKMTSEAVDLIVARGGNRAKAIMESDQQLNVAIVGRTADGVPALEMLTIIRRQRPQVRSILLADSSDLSLSIEALHGGVVDHVLNPPLRERELRMLLALPAPRVSAQVHAAAAVQAQK